MNCTVVKVGDISISNAAPFALMVGPCALESRDHAMFMANAISEVSRRVGRRFIFKTSFDKANRSSASTGRGVGLEEALGIFVDIKNTFGCPIVTDVHQPYQCAEVAEVVDVLQIPAFLCRQTDLLVAAAATGKAINVKKGQFLAPWDMKNVCNKISSVGNNNIILCERGTCFGYNSLVNDFTGLPIMASYGYPVIFDATHSVQKPGGLGESTGGNRQYVEPLARAALSVGCAGLFIETHNDPDQAVSDGPNMLPLSYLYDFWMRMVEFDELSKKNPLLDIK